MTPAAPGGAPATRAPLVSVVMPFLDAQRFLEEAIDSVLAQTLQSWELLLIDDGSTDASSALARGYAQRFPDRIRYFEHPGHVNRGKGTSRNVGIAQARGSLVSFLDADDVLLPHKLARQAELLRSLPDAVLVYGNTEYWFNWDPRAPDAGRDRMGKLGVVPDRLYDPPDLLTAYLRDPGIVPCICGLLARRAVIGRVGGFDESIQDLFEDQVFLARMILAGPVYVEAGCGERYRQHAESSSARAVAEGRYHPTRANEAHRLFLEWLAGYVASQPAQHDRRLRRALRAAQRPYRLREILRRVRPA